MLTHLLTYSLTDSAQLCAAALLLRVLARRGLPNPNPNLNPNPNPSPNPNQVDTVVRRTCGGYVRDATQDALRRFWGRSDAARADMGWVAPRRSAGRPARRPHAHDAGAEWWSPWDALHATLHERSTAVPVYHDDHPSVTAANLEETLRDSGGRVGGVDACQIPGLACRAANRTARREASAGVRYNQLPRSMRRRAGRMA